VSVYKGRQGIDGDSDVLDRTVLRDRTRESWNEGSL
jgi:hypothetical protein